jgi:O-antigen ligase
MIYLLIGYMWLFIHRPFEIWPWMADLRIERVYMLVTIAYWAMQPKTWTANRLNKAIVFLAGTIIVAAAVSPYEGLDSIAVQNWLKLLVFFVLVMSSVSQPDDLKKLVVGFVVIMGLYELHSLREYFNGRGVYRMGTWRMIGVDSSLSDPNSFAASVIYGLPMLLPVYALATRKWHTFAIGGLAGLGVVCILLTGSRSGFAALAVGSLCFALSTRFRWRILATLIIAAPLIWANLSDNLRERYMTLIDPSRGPANAEESAESRKDFFFKAIDIWKENPIFGVGPRGFAYASGTGMQSHSLYAETMSELGAVGIVAVLFLIVGFFRNYFDARYLVQTSANTPETRFQYMVVAATAITILLLLFLGFAGHNLFRFTWLWYAAFSALALRFLQEECWASEDRHSEDVYDAAFATEMHDKAFELCSLQPSSASAF